MTAIIRSTALEHVEQRLQGMGIHGMSVSKVRGFGEYANFFKPDPMVDRIRIEVYTHAEEAERIANAVVDAAHSGASGDGIVAVEPVDTILLIRAKRPASADEI